MANVFSYKTNAEPVSTKSLEYSSINHDGLKRTYGIYIPTIANQSSSQLPLVIMLHGGGGFAKNAAKMTGLSEKAEKEGFIVVYPEGTGKFKSILLTWNAGHCCGYALKNNIDDVGFISKLIDKLIDEYPVDKGRIYVTGLSNGGMLTHRIGSELSHKITAIAPVISGLRGDEPAPLSPVPAIIINGSLDESIPESGGEQGKKGSKHDDDTLLKPASYQGDYWAKANRCEKEPIYKTFGKAPIHVWQYKCPAESQVIRYLVGDNGHAWPSGQRGSPMGDTPSQSLNATDEIWDFFKNFSK